MSAWFVERAHIDVLVTAGLALKVPLPELSLIADNPVSFDSPETAAGYELWRENAFSIAYRYAHYPEDIERNQAELDGYTSFTPRPVEDLLFVLKQIHCYDYQTCEHPQYKSSPAYRYVRALITAIEQRLGASDEDLTHLAGYNAATWGVNEKDDGSIWLDDEEYYTWVRAENERRRRQAATTTSTGGN